MPKAKLAIMLLAAAVAVAAQQTSTVTAAEAKDHVGERATVCGQGASTHLAARAEVLRRSTRMLSIQGLRNAAHGADQ